jgi:predicted Zn-dependent peptidase
MHLIDTATSKAFELVPNDPMQVHQCTLANGLRLFFSINQDEPRIATEIAVRAGSKHDPASSTGLAHYFEHMMFKGTDRIGTLNWEAENKILEQIKALYEQHRATSDAAEKRQLYIQIDQLSAQAAKFATANEYDKLLGAMGAKGTNAYTWVDQTVYLNDIPTNELERWFQVESERFRRPVLRLFHTELETVFEEFNISQDKDFRKVSKVMLETLMPTHPYGTQTTLGKGEDLKNPSQEAIYKFFDQHYVPNNMAITLCGDFDVVEAKRLAEQYFGSYASKQVPAFSFEPQAEITSRQERTVLGEETEWVELAWRLPGAGHPDHIALTLLSMVLYNEVAGLIDTHLVQSQKLLTGYAYIRMHEDYSMLILYGKPREGQSLQEVEQLLLEQLQAVRSGQFEQWLIEGASKMFEVEELKRLKSNNHRASAITNMFVLGRPWAEMVTFFEQLKKCTKSDVVRVAEKWLKNDNFVAITKLHGKDTNVLKVEKPPITPVEVNRNEVSDFAQQILATQSPEIAPLWPDFKKGIQTATIQKGVKLHAVTEAREKIGTLEWIWPVGKLYNNKLPMLAGYLNYLSTPELSAAQIRQEFYRLGVQMEVKVTDHFTVIKLNGLDASIPEAAKLVAHVLQNVLPDAPALTNLKADVLKQRENQRKNKDHILRQGMKPYAIHGPAASARLVISEAELATITPEQLVQLLFSVRDMEHQLHYHGPRTLAQIKKVVKTAWAPTSALAKVPRITKLKELKTTKNQVFFVHFPMVQVEILQVSKGTQRLNKEEYLMERWFNNYFGTSMSSVVFQEIREARAMAYQTYAINQTPALKDEAHYFYTFVGTQPDKMQAALEVMSDLVENMPFNPELVEQARQNSLKVLQANRLPLSSYFWRKNNLEHQGWKDEPLREVLDHLTNADVEALRAFHIKYIKNRKSTWLVLGDRSQLDFKVLRKIGRVRELSIDEVLGY